MSFGLTANGFKRKRLLDIALELEASFKAIWGENIDVTPQSNFGQLIGIMSERIANGWENSENVYNSQYPSTSVGDQLSNVVMYNGIERQDATSSTATVTLFGAEGTVIDSGNIVSVVGTNEQFVTNLGVVIPVAGQIDVPVTAVNTGAISANAGTLTQIETPIFGWTAVSNALDAEVGRDAESDAELRERRILSTQALGDNLVDSLFGQLLNIDGVEDAVVKDNKTDVVDADGIPGHRFLSVVLGGANEDIANAIWKNTPQGINSFGAITEQITDAQGFLQDVFFSRPTDVPIYFDITISTAADFPASGVEDIKSNIVIYGVDEFRIGEDVILSEFYTAINLTPGITSIDLKMGLAPSPTGIVNLPITLEEISRYDTSRVEVTIV